LSSKFQAGFYMPVKPFLGVLPKGGAGLLGRDLQVPGLQGRP